MIKIQVKNQVAITEAFKQQARQFLAEKTGTIEQDQPEPGQPQPNPCNTASQLPAN